MALLAYEQNNADGVCLVIVVQEKKAYRKLDLKNNIWQDANKR